MMYTPLTHMRHTFPISNGILKDGHPEKIGIAIWEFMWCIDHTTRIDDEGYGVVLGGKPIQLSEIGFGHRNSISRNLGRLRDHKYIEMVRTPRGIKIRVKKVIKWFTKNGDAHASDSPKMVQRFTKNGEPNKTIKRIIKGNDNKKMIRRTPKKLEGKVSARDRNDCYRVIDAFEQVNVHWDTLHESSKQYDAALRIILRHNLETVLKVIKVLPKTNDMEFFPRIYTPVQLEEKWESLHHAWKDAVRKKIKNTPKIIL